MILLIANWKLAPETLVKAQLLAKATRDAAKKYKKTIRTVACVPSVYIESLAKMLKTSLALGAQDVSSFESGAHTGEVSARMLRGVGATYVLVGHSEVRARGVSNSATNEQLRAVLGAKMTPVLCIGETERDSQGFYLSSIKDQLEGAFEGLSAKDMRSVVIAYEPVWAIGASATREATPEECREMVIYIRKIVATLYDVKLATQVTILYGGSVSETNADLFITQGDAQGLLVGRVSTDPKRFLALMAQIG